MKLEYKRIKSNYKNQQISIKPVAVCLATQQSIEFLKRFGQNTIFVDATGSLVKPLQEQQLLHYTVSVLFPKTTDEPRMPVICAETVQTKHAASEIKVQTS
jgi:hypothetical protein